MGDSFADSSAGFSENKINEDDVDNTNGSNPLTNSRTLHFNINEKNNFKKLVEYI